MVNRMYTALDNENALVLVVSGLIVLSVFRLVFSYCSKPSVAQSSRATSLNCIVCFNLFTPTTTPARMVTDSCNHEIDVCLLCIAKSIAADLDSKEADQLKFPSCPQLLGYQDVKSFVDPETFARYDDVLSYLQGYNNNLNDPSDTNATR